MAKLTDAIEKWAAKPMRPGEGLHTDIFRAAIFMLEGGHSDDAVFRFLREAADKVTDRTVPDREIQGAIQSAHARMNGDAILTPRWPAFEAQLRAEIIARMGITMERLAKRSEAEHQNPVFYLEMLYDPHEWVCIGATAYDFTTKLRDAWYPVLQTGPHEYINPSAMTADLGFTKDGKVSAHCLDICGPKTYQVVEFDTGQAHEHAALLWHLAKKMGLVLMVYSGGKSLHGWYNVRDQSEAAVEDFFCSAVQLGADPKMWSRCQFSRLPAGQNAKTGKHQTVVLFEPSHL